MGPGFPRGAFLPPVTGSKVQSPFCQLKCLIGGSWRHPPDAVEALTFPSALPLGEGFLSPFSSWYLCYCINVPISIKLAVDIHGPHRINLKVDLLCQNFKTTQKVSQYLEIHWQNTWQIAVTFANQSHAPKGINPFEFINRKGGH